MRGAALALLALLAPWLMAAAPDLSDLSFVQRPGAAMPMAAPLVEATGAATDLAQAAGGRPLIVDFGYFHCPTLCGATRDDLLGALRQSGLPVSNYALAMVSIDPAETPADAQAALADDRRRFAQDGAAWHYLTGPAASLAALQSAAGFRARWDPLLKQFLHPEGLVFVSPAGRVAGYQFGYDDTAAGLRRGLALAAAEQAQPVANPLLLLCFHFDPVTGRYTLAIMQVLRLAGAATVLAIVLLIAGLLRRRPIRS